MDAGLTARECIFCGRPFETQITSQTKLFSSWRVKCANSLRRVLDDLDPSDRNTKEISPKYCPSCFQLVIDIDFFLDGIQRFESLLSSATTKLQNIIRERKSKKIHVKVENEWNFQNEETESMGSGSACSYSEIDNPNYTSIDQEWTKKGESTRKRKVEPKRSKSIPGRNLPIRFKPSKSHEVKHDLHAELAFPCPFMDCHKRFADQLSVALHIHEKHYREERSSCQFCGLTFRQGDDGVKNLEEHETTHRNAEIPFSCVVGTCTTSFTNFHDLKKHVLEEHEETILRCDICPGKVFRTVSRLKFHRDHVHAQKMKDEGFKCVHSGCSFIGQNRSRLKNHTKIHRVDRPYTCDDCGATYKTRVRLFRRNSIPLSDFLSIMLIKILCIPSGDIEATPIHTHWRDAVQVQILPEILQSGP